MSLTPSQEVAVNEVLSFLLSDEPVMVINGEAGTGKSFTLGQIIKDLPEFIKIRKVAGFDDIKHVRLAAPTNKAVENLRDVVDALPARAAPIIEDFSTLHRLFGIPLDFKKRSQYNKAKRIPENSLVMIDEMPMISTGMLDAILKNTPNSKIIFFGDGNQLPPVEEPTQPDGTVTIPVLTKGWRTVTLREPVRQDLQSELYQFIKKVCDGVTNNAPIDPSILQGCEGVSFLDEVGVRSMLDALYDPNTHYLNVMTLTYTNKASNFWAKNFQEYLNIPIVVPIGSEVNTLRGKGVISDVEENSITITNAENGELNIIEYVTYSYKCRGDSRKSKFIKNISRAKSYMKRIQSQIDMYSTASNAFENILRDTPNNNPVLNWDIKQLKKDSAKLSSLIESHENSDIDFRLAMTVHKAQGSTYEYVFVDMSDFTAHANLMSKDTLRRLLYVAVSRAKEHVIFYGDFPAKLFN